MKLKTLLQTIEGLQTISISEEENHIFCGMDCDCLDCQYHEDNINDPNDPTNNNGCGYCAMPEEEMIRETEKHSLYDGRAEDVPYKLMDVNVLSVYAYIQGQGKGGRKKHGTKAVIEIEVNQCG